MRIKQNLPTYNAPFYLRTEYSERKKSGGPNKKKFVIFAQNLIRIAICAGRLRCVNNGAGMISPSLNLRAEQVE
jgi:hypothetical protein